jgi:riboflavin synthase
MFTGIVEQVGRIESVLDLPAGVRIRVAAEPGDLGPGGSIAVNGCCLTAVAVGSSGFDAELTPETLARTAFSGGPLPGRLVNLERPVRAQGRLDGHIVQGHVDGTGRLRSLRPLGGGADLEVELPEELARYVVPKGSIAVDGISLTVVAKEERGFSVAVIPYTLEHTNLRAARTGDAVNLEVDILAKYVEALLPPRADEGRRNAP